MGVVVGGRNGKQLPTSARVLEARYWFGRDGMVIEHVGSTGGRQGDVEHIRRSSDGRMMAACNRWVLDRDGEHIGSEADRSMEVDDETIHIGRQDEAR